MHRPRNKDHIQFIRTERKTPAFSSAVNFDPDAPDVVRPTGGLFKVTFLLCCLDDSESN